MHYRGDGKVPYWLKRALEISRKEKQGQFFSPSELAVVPTSPGSSVVNTMCICKVSTELPRPLSKSL